MTMKGLAKWMYHTGHAVLDAIAPPLCVACDAQLPYPMPPLCTSCMELAQPMPSPICHHCGVGVSRHAEDLPYHGDLCERCIHFPPHFTVARAAFDYEGLLATILPAIKYGKLEVHMHNLSSLIIPFARDLITQWHQAESAQTPLLLVPMPMHWRALQKRTFSQTMILTECMAKHTRTLTEFAPHALTKARHTSQQAGLTLAERRLNLKDAMRADARQVEGRIVVLVDDVMTSGSSANEAAKTLFAAGARKVLVLTLARATH